MLKNNVSRVYRVGSVEGRKVGIHEAEIALAISLLLLNYGRGKLQLRGYYYRKNRLEIL